jgi:hypothetical protein
MKNLAFNFESLNGASENISRFYVLLLFQSDVFILVIPSSIDKSYLQRGDGSSQISATINAPQNDYAYDYSFLAYFWSSFVPLRDAEEKKTELKNLITKKENCESKETS